MTAAGILIVIKKRYGYKFTIIIIIMPKFFHV